MDSSVSVATGRPSTNSQNVTAQSLSRYGPGWASLTGRTVGASQFAKCLPTVSSRARVTGEKSNDVPDAIRATTGKGLSLAEVWFPRCRTSGFTTPSPALFAAKVAALSSVFSGRRNIRDGLPSYSVDVCEVGLA